MISSKKPVSSAPLTPRPLAKTPEPARDEAQAAPEGHTPAEAARPNGKADGQVDGQAAESAGALKKVLGDVAPPSREQPKTHNLGAALSRVGLRKLDEQRAGPGVDTAGKKAPWGRAVACALLALTAIDRSLVVDAARVALSAPAELAMRAVEKIAPGVRSHRSALDVRMQQMQRMESAARGEAPPSAAAAFDALSTIGGGEVKARLLSANLDAWNGRWVDLERATKSIDASYFIFEKDPFGYAYLGHLLHKQMAGAHVRVMTDAMADTFGKNGFKMPGRGKDYLQELVNHGGEAFIYHPIWQRPFDALKGGFSVLASNHDKIQVVDGTWSVTGGRNVAKDYFADPRDMKEAWRDIDVALEGAGAARGLTAAFEAELGGTYARPVSADRLGNWVKRDLELLGAYQMMDLWLKDAPMAADAKDAARASPEQQKQLAEDLLARTLPRLQRAPNERELAFLRENATSLVHHLEARGSRHAYDANNHDVHAGDSKILDQTSTAGERVNDFAAGMTLLVRGAQKSVVIENPYVVLTEEMIKAMEEASQRGVTIEFITNSPLSTDSDVTQAFFLEDWAYLLARVPTARVWVTTGETKFHAKSAVIDDEISLVTTYNLDLLSGYVNSEVGAAVKSKDFAKELHAAFEADRADPRHGMLEYTIQRDAEGKAVLVDGKPVVTFGPEDHLPKDVLEIYAKKRQTWGHTLRANLPYLEPLRHPSLRRGS